MGQELVKAADAVIIDNQGRPNSAMVAVQNATVQAVSQSGASRDTIRVDMGHNSGNVNDVVQFDVTNVAGGAANERVRIGSWVALTDAYIQFGLPVGASDSATGCADQFGAKVLAIQGFSRLCISNPMFIKEIHVISSDATQLNKQFTHNMIMPDFTVLPANQNIASTLAKSDQRANLNVATGSWLLSGRNWLEFTSVATKSFSVLLFINAINDVAQFVPLGRA